MPDSCITWDNNLNIKPHQRLSLQVPLSQADGLASAVMRVRTCFAQNVALKSLNNPPDVSAQSAVIKRQQMPCSVRNAAIS
jgi:hypothetical protein